MEASAEIAGVKDFLDRNLPSLSGGELQKVYVAQALAQDTPVLVMDEPSRFLDPLNRLRFYQLLQDLTARGKTIVCVSHDAEIFEIPQARFLGLREGALVWDGVLEEMGVRAFREEVYQLRS
jgi:iron complex transport system ATP-binding protein